LCRKRCFLQENELARPKKAVKSWNFVTFVFHNAQLHQYCSIVTQYFVCNHYSTRITPTMYLKNFVLALESVLPPSSAMKGDRIGLQLQSGRTEISSVLISMELTDAVAEEAVLRGADCILAFHPLIFVPITSLTETERVGRICTKLIASGIALVIAHTNFDAHPHGTSTILSEKLGFRRESVLAADATNEGFGMGIVAFLDAPEPLEHVVERVRNCTHSPVRYNVGKPAMVRRVAIVGGSGASFIDDALRADVDAFITADLKYHDFHRTQGIMALIDPGHYEMEQFVSLGLERIVQDIVEHIYQRIDKHIVHETAPTLTITRSRIVPNPVRYYPSTEVYSIEQQNELAF
jgi:dinuclear metal center YbgI/SA1388 family protein